MMRTVDSNVAKRRCAVVLHVSVGRVEKADEDRDGASVDELLPVLVCEANIVNPAGQMNICNIVPECVMLRRAPVALRCTRISLERASRVRGTSAPDLAIFVLLSSKRITC